MKIKFLLEKNSFFIFSALLIALLGVGFVLATGWTSGDTYHLNMYSDGIRGKSGETVLVSDNLEVTGNIYSGYTSAVNEDQEADDGNNHKYVDLESADTHVCFLTKWYLDCHDGCSENGCRVSIGGDGMWVLDLYTWDNSLSDADVILCGARCIEYADSSSRGADAELIGDSAFEEGD